jgi:integrase
MAELEKRADQQYRIRVYLGRVNGVKKFKEEVFHGPRNKALDRKRELEQEAARGIIKRAGTCTLAEFLDRWLVTISDRVAARTHNDYADLLERYVRPKLGKMKLGEIQPLHIQDVYDGMRKLSPRTVRYTHTVLRNALKQAVAWQMLGHNPTDNVHLPRSNKRIIQALTEEQVPRLLKAAKEAGHYCLFLVAVTTGLRPEEYLALDWESVDLEAKTVSVKRALVYERSGKGWQFAKPKTKKGLRTIPLPQMTVDALRQHQREQLKARMTAKNWKDLNLVFSTKGGPLEVGNVSTRAFKPLLDKAALPDTTRLYDLRHTYVTLSLAAGVPVKTVSEWAGHASVAFTLDTYAHLIPSMVAAGAQQVEQMFTGILGGTLGDRAEKRSGKKGKRGTGVLEFPNKSG